MSASVAIAIVGAGSRGSGYAAIARQLPRPVRVVGVAEPRQSYRERLAADHGVPSRNVFTDWRRLAEQPRFADAVLICTPDAQHDDAAIAFAEKGYAILLEKPMAPTAPQCVRIVREVKARGVLFAVAHVLRYTAYTRRLKRLIDAGAVGSIVSVQHLEPVGYWHQAHSYVRGNWRNERESSPMLLGKSCHDIDWLRYIIGARCLRVCSYGGRHHFRRDQKPAGAADRCIDCAIEPSCPYSALKIYLGRYARGERGWPLDVLVPDVAEEALRFALREGPYGRCVYACDNDVVDHQVVALEYEGSRTATFTMTGFNRGGHRQTRIFGTRGEIVGNGRTIEHFDFLSDATETIDTAAADATVVGGHGGGDGGVLGCFVEAVATGDPSPILSGADETLETHLTVFAAERSRVEGCAVEVGTLTG